MRHVFVCSVLVVGMTVAGGGQHAGQHPTHEHAAHTPADATSTLSAEQVQQLLAGDGMGLAKAAELNGYPGPKHVLERADQLTLSDAQRERVTAIRARMLEKAQRLGREIVAAERALDEAFASKRIDAADLSARTNAIGALEAELRATHLGAHLESLTVLNPEQVKIYYARGSH